LKSAGVVADLRAIVGETTAAQAREQHADLVIIGQGLLHEHFGRLRTHAFSIIQQSGCPVLRI
jgi:hypothetical protein